jgi:hypothetical protein
MYWIALMDHAFDKHSGIDPSHSVMRLFHVAQDALLRLAGLGVDRDHLAARVTLEDGKAAAARQMVSTVPIRSMFILA